MSDTLTPLLGLTQPAIGASRDTWGTKLNANFATLDSYVGNSTPIGALVDFAGPQPPPGWLICDGRAVSRTTYAALFAVIGGYWGAGDGSTTFNLPNLNGRSTIGPGAMMDQGGYTNTFIFSSYQGFVWNQITQSNLPNYALYVAAAGTHSHGGATAPGGNHTHGTDVQGYHNHGGTQGAYTGIGISDPGHAHGYYSTNLQGGATVYAAPPGYDLQFNWSSTSSNGTGIGISDPGHAHGINTDGGHAHNITYSGNLQLPINPDGGHTHTVMLWGGGAPLEVLGPVAVVTKLIFAGGQAFAAMTVATLHGEMISMLPASATIEAGEWLDVDEVAALRQELREMREMMRHLMPPRRIVQTPLRGSR